jgi:hypothetical protein
VQLLSWLRKQTTGRPQTRRTPAGRPAPRCRPRLEALEGRALPSFGAPVAYALNGPQALVTADVNGDGKSDLISLVDGGAFVAVQLGNRNGSFGPATEYYDGASGGDIMTALAVGNVNGKPVVVVAGWIEDNIGASPAPVSVLGGDGHGSFTLAATNYVLPSGNSPVTSLALADLYGNGTLAFVAGTQAAGVFVGSPYGHVQALNIPAVASNPGPCWVAVGDVNGDGKPDIVVANSGVDLSGASVSVLLNNGNGTFPVAQAYTVGGAPTGVALGDFNRDGKADIVTANANSTMSVLLNNGDGTFGTAQNYAIGGPANSVAVGDFNQDGFLDVVTTGAEMDVLQNNDNGTFGAYQKLGPAGSNVVAADFDGNGFPDLAEIDASSSSYSGSIDVVLNNADSTAGAVSVSFGGITYDKKKKLYSETVMLTNNTGSTVTGPLSLELTNLAIGVVLTDATGTTNGNPYLRFLSTGKALQEGVSVSITLTFSAPSLSAITFGTEVVPLQSAPSQPLAAATSGG